MNKQEVIKSLEKKRETALDNLEYYRDKENEKYEKMNRARVDSYMLAIQLVEQIDEPQSEKVEVTEKQAELLRAFRDESLYELLANCLGEDEELMAKAHLYGYTVKPKRWVVKFGSNLAYYFNGWYTDASIRPNGHSNKGDSSVIVFTDKSKAEAVATLVDGTVEEV
ncbi:hypothetical protein [Enterococcus diestrammenae]|uniref:Uncharacterized protein n=1 Tax=Enterococcus diestrammenae TaxID=1155073 RepID=A0ABV0F2I9_9ENTE|nr:hypothetical protein [Enterococcus diestrammenae]KAF1299696.1 hypothetical protein BAU18_07145 [Enterococcus diestrammenae]